MTKAAWAIAGLAFMAGLILFIGMLRSTPESVIRQAIRESSLGYPPAKAERALRERRFEHALRDAGACVQTYSEAGRAIQAELSQDYVGPIRNLENLNEATRRQLMRNGPLNALAHCLVVRAEAAEHLGRSDIAKQAWTEAAQLEDAVVFAEDRVWRPSDRAEERLSRID